MKTGQNRVLVGLPERLDKTRRALQAQEKSTELAEQTLAAQSYDLAKATSCLEKIAEGRGKAAKAAKECLHEIEIGK